jgi:hypothetical protein
LAKLPVKVPVVVTGEPEMVKTEDGNASATLVTEPVPAVPLDAEVIRPLASTVIEAKV